VAAYKKYTLVVAGLLYLQSTSIKHQGEPPPPPPPPLLPRPPSTTITRCDWLCAASTRRNKNILTPRNCQSAPASCRTLAPNLNKLPCLLLRARGVLLFLLHSSLPPNPPLPTSSLLLIPITLPSPSLPPSSSLYYLSSSSFFLHLVFPSLFLTTSTLT
jgi:hypothetical protein